MGNLGRSAVIYAERQSTLEEVLKTNMEAFVYLVCDVDEEEDQLLFKDRSRLIASCYAAMMAALVYYRKILKPAIFRDGLTSIMESLALPPIETTEEGLRPLTYQTLLIAALANAEQKEQSSPPNS